MKKTKRIIFIFLPLLLIGAITTYFYFSSHKLENKEVKNTMKEENPSKTLEVARETTDYQEKYKNDYQEIHYQEEKDFIKKINTLLDLNYKADEINKIYAYIKEENILKLLNLEKVNLDPYYQIKNFEVDKIPEYENYQEKYKTTLEEAVLKVNIGLDHDFYTQIQDIENKDEYTVLVNKYHSLGDYAPTDLKSLSYDSKYQLREKAADAFEKLVSAAKLENVFIRPYSAYRSYTYQTGLYDRYVKRDGKSEADTYSARPGHSEHQTGLAVDVWTEGKQEITVKDAEWLKQNSYKYGFIIRYTRENQNITGYIAEPWHLRYLGIEIATDVVEKNLTYDEYYDLYIK